MYSEESFDHPYTNLARLASKNLSGLNLGSLKDANGNAITTDQIVDKLVEYLGNFKVDLGFKSFSIFGMIPDSLEGILIPILTGKLKEKINEKIKSAMDMRKEIQPGDKTISKALASMIYDLFVGEFKDHVLELYPDMIRTVDNTRFDITSFSLYAQDENIGYFDFMNADASEVVCGLILTLTSNSGILFGAGRDYVIKNLTGIIWQGLDWVLLNIFGIDLKKEARESLTGESGISELIGAWKSAGGATAKALDFIEYLRANRELSIGLKFDSATKIRWLQMLETWWVVPYQTAVQGNEFLSSLTYPYLEAIKEAFIVEVEKVAIPINRVGIKMDESIRAKIMASRGPATVTFDADQFRASHPGSASGSVPIVPIVVGGIGLLLLLKYFKK